ELPHVRAERAERARDGTAGCRRAAAAGDQLPLPRRRAPPGERWLTLRSQASRRGSSSAGYARIALMRATSWSTLAASAPQPVLNARQRALTAIGQSRVLRAPRKAASRSLSATWVTPWPVLAKRADLPLLLNRRRLLGCGVEVGVKEGAF